MKKIKDILLEKEKEKKKELKFVETDPQEPFPNDTISYIKKEINKICRDLSVNWSSPIDVVNAAFHNLEIPIPKANLKERWAQYTQLFGYAIKNLFDARGFKADWSIKQ